MNLRAKTCSICKQKYQPKGSFDKVCSSFECRHAFALKVAEKSKAKREKEAKRQQASERKADREKKETLKTRAEILQEAQVAFNAYIRERDRIAGHPCISSGKPLDWYSGNAVDCGHYRSVGSSPHLRFNEDNAHAQSKHDNRYLAGNVVEYRKGLIQRIGLEAVEALESDNAPRHYTRDELIRIRDKYRAKLKELKCKT